MSSDVHASQTTAPQATKLARKISGRLLYVFILGDVLGAGIYAVVGELSRARSAARSGCRCWSPWCWRC